jgi:predicted DNA-binding transcriptional regulator YafY
VSFAKAEQLLQLATLVAARHTGVTLGDVIARFSVSKRTAQRMLRALENQFSETAVRIDGEGRRRWQLPSGALRDLISLTPEELAAVDIGIETLKRSGLAIEADELLSLREKIVALVPRSRVARIETDHEALLEAQGLAARPGPRQRVDRKVVAAIGEAIKACRILEVDYQSRNEPAPRVRRLAPYGLLTGLRRYLVGRPEEDASGPVRLYVIESMRAARVTNDAFVREPEFNLQAFANRAFGVFQNEEEFGEVVWRFSSRAADHARGFEFHPGQVMEDQPDGSLLVRFWASGHLEMAWHLYVWGTDVEVIAPERLRVLVNDFRRSDFPAFP